MARGSESATAGEEVLRVALMGVRTPHRVYDDVRVDVDHVTHVGRVLSKTGAHSRAQLVVVAYETGLVRPGEDR